MPITQLTISNFKGVSKPVGFDIRPLTIFLGGNYSGKSSCIHALVALAQTLKLGNPTPALVLDEDFAHVHLGRFVEIAHSHLYADAIALGINIGDRRFDIPTRRTQADTFVEGEVRAAYSFKSTLRTQELYVESGTLSIGGRAFTTRRSAKPPYKFSTIVEETKKRYDTERTGNFMFQIRPVQQMASDDGLEWFESFWLWDMMQREVATQLRETRYLGPFRQPPLRRYPFRGATAKEVGPQGEATITLLAGEHVQSQDRIHARRVNRWLTTLGLAHSVELSRVGTSDLFDVSMKLSDGTKLPIADLGYGLSQVLPVITQCSFAPNGSTLLFEQPELHLHENAAKKLAYVFHETAEEKGARIVVETHSKELVYETLALIKSGKLKADDLAIYKVERVDGASTYKRVGIEWDGAYLDIDDPWVNALTNS